jgi:hypothetical protein
MEKKNVLPNSRKVLSENGERVTPEAKDYAYSPNGGFDAITGRVYGPEESRTRAKTERYAKRGASN